MTLKRITTRMLQAHREITIELPEYGLIGFYGDNSHGKSVIRRAYEDIIKGTIYKPACRKALVNDSVGNMWGEFECERYDGMLLLVHIHLEASQTWFELVRPGSTDRNRAYLSSKLLGKYVEEFGFHYLDKHKFTLNICDGDDAMLFFNTPTSMNYDILSSALTDTTAEASLLRIEETISNARKMKNTFKQQLEVSTAAMREVTIYDIDTETARRNKLTYLYKNLSNIYIPVIEELPDMREVNFVDVPIPLIPKMAYPQIYDVNVEIGDISEEILLIAEELEEIQNGKCPTCGKEFLDGI